MATGNQKGYVQSTSNTIQSYFVGFNTVNQPNPPYSLTNLDIIKRDILNQFATPIGSRVMLPSFGTYIYNYLFDPFDEITKNSIIDDAVRVVQSDPRVQLVNIDVYQEDQSLNIVMNLYFVPESVTDNLFVAFSLNDQETF
jgi:phage baseplate assembly protein W